MPQATYPIKTFADLRMYIAADMFRYMTSTSAKAFLRAWYIAGFRYTFFMRCCRYYSHRLWHRPLFLLCRIALRHYPVKYGFQIPWQTDIGPGLMIGHYGSIIINPNSRIGINCNISVGVLMGLTHDIEHHIFYYPTIGHRVSLANGVKVIGNVHIDDGAVVGVGAVVTAGLDKDAVAVGVPARVIAHTGSAAYVGSFHPATIPLMNEAVKASN